MRIIRQYGLGRTLFLAVLAVIALIWTASAKTICNQCKGTGKVLEVTRQCPVHPIVPGFCANCDGSGLIGPTCPYCGGLGYILTPAEKEADRKARAAADAKAQAEQREMAVKRAEEKRVEDSIKVVEKAKSDSIIATRITGARSYKSVARIISMNMATVRFAYNRRLRDKPNLVGKVIIKFTINEFGTVLSAQAINSTLADSELESDLVEIIKKLNFEKIFTPGDITTVSFPFAFET